MNKTQHATNQAIIYWAHFYYLKIETSQQCKLYINQKVNLIFKPISCFL